MEKDFQSILQNLLPPCQRIRLTSDIDRYGFSSFLAKQCGLLRLPRSSAYWVHGWIWSTTPTAELLACSRLHKETLIIVRNEIERKALILEGFENIKIGGLPFSYIPRQHLYRSENALLAFPPHSAEAERLSTNQENYFNYLESIKKDFDGIYVSIYYFDLHTPIHSAVLARGLNVIEGARPNDANALLRVRSILDGFNYVTSNVIGSHMLYALYCGCKFSFSGPFYSYDESLFLTNGNPHKHSKQYIARCLQLQSESCVRELFPRFFVEHPTLGLQDLDFATDSIGKKYVIPLKEIIDVLGWSLRGQFNHYINGAVRRLKCVRQTFPPR